MNHEEIKEQLPLYVLGGLDEETAAVVVRHLAEPCDSCVAEAREWQEVVGLIPLGVTQTGPGDAVKERLMIRVRQDQGGKVLPLRQRRWRAAWVAIPLAAAAMAVLAIGLQRYQASVEYAARQAQQVDVVKSLLDQEQNKLAAREKDIEQLTTQANVQAKALEEKNAHLAQVESALRRQQAEVEEQRKLVSLREQELLQARSAGSAQQTQVSAQVAAYQQEIAALKVDLTKQRDLAAASEREVSELRATVEQQKTLVSASVQESEQLRAMVVRQRGIIEVLTSPGLHLERLQKAKLGVSSQGHVLWNERTKTWVFYAFNMPQPPPGKEYQVWFMTEKEGPVSAGLFTPDQSGTGVVLAKPPSKLYGEIVAAAVTLEPAGGLPKPSGEMYLRGSL